jgi:hypothetical protein
MSDWQNWPKETIGQTYSKENLLNGSADVLVQSLPYVQHEFVSILRYETEPGVYDGELAATLEELVQEVVLNLATESRVYLVDLGAMYLPLRRHIEVIVAPLDKSSILDLFAAEGAVLRAAASSGDDRTFFRLITLWSAYMHKLGSSTLVYHTLRYLDLMAFAASAGRRHVVAEYQQRVLCTASRARYAYRNVNKGVTDQKFYDSVRIPSCHVIAALTLIVHQASSTSAASCKYGEP